MRFLSSVGTKELVRDPQLERATGIPRWRFGHKLMSRSWTRDVEKLVEQSFDRNVWAMRACETIAYNAAMLEVICRKGDKRTGTETDHPLLPLFNFRSREVLRSPAFMKRVQLSLQLELSTKGVFIETLRAGGGTTGTIVGWDLLPPHLTYAIPDPETFVSKYVVVVGAQQWEVPAENVIWLRRPHPLDPYRSYTPAEAAGLAIDTDLLARLYNYRFMQNDGRPGGIVGVQGEIEDEDADELQAFFDSPTPGRWKLLDNIQGLDLKDMSTTPRDAQYVEGRKGSKQETLAAWGVGDTMIGNASEQTFANADAEERIFWTQKMEQHLELVSSAYDQFDENPATFFRHNLSDVAVFQKIEEERRAGLREDCDAGRITINEYRDQIGLTKFDHEEADVPHLGMSLVELWPLETAAAAPSPTNVVPIAPAPAQVADALQGAASLGGDSPLA